MPRRLLLEGSDPELIIRRARLIYDGTMRIVSVERHTRGGVLGFFGKRIYEVTVEIDGGAPIEVNERDLVTSRIADVAAAQSAMRATVDLERRRAPRASEREREEMMRVIALDELR